MIKAIAVVGDLLRPDGQGHPGGTDAATEWLFNAVKRPAHMASHLPVEPVTVGRMPGLAEALCAARVPADSALYWAGRYQGLRGDDPWAGAILDRLRGRFCIGAELPPYMTGLLTEAGVPWIDIRVHPVRFLDDLLFAVRGCSAEMQACLAGMSLPEQEVIITAGLVEAMCRHTSNAGIPPHSLLVVGQRPMDSSQIVGGGFFDAYAHEPSIAAICARYQAVLLKPHPYPDGAHGLLCVAGVQPNVAGIISDNTYRVMAMANVAGVLTVNSSVAYEAGYFGKTVHALAPLPVRVGWSGSPPAAGLYASIRDHVLTGDFWRSVLAPLTAVTAADGVRLAPKPNRLRIARDEFWNYHQIDTDRIPLSAPRH